MKHTAFTEFSDEELLTERKKLKSSSMINAVLCGVLIGVSIYSTIRNGLGIFTFFPLYFAFIVFNNKSKIKALNDELKSRDLE